MAKWTFGWSTLLLAGTMMAGGCGGSSGSATGGGGIGGTGAVSARGPITDFGSVIVNGIEFQTTAATRIVVEDTAVEEQDLRIGMVVQVTGTLDLGGVTGEADAIEYADDVEGPVESIDVGAGTLQVLGRLVVDARFAGGQIGLGQLEVGNVVEVSGLVDGDGTIHATFIEKKADAFQSGEDEIEIRGVVTDLDEEAQTFQLEDLSVLYATAQLPDGAPAVGQLVEVKSTQGVAGDVLQASKVEIKQEVSLPEEGTKVEIEGFVSAVDSPTEFTVNGAPVDAAGAEFKNGSAEDIVENVRVEVEGIVRNGVLLAAKVEIKRSDD